MECDLGYFSRCRIRSIRTKISPFKLGTGTVGWLLKGNVRTDRSHHCIFLICVKNVVIEKVCYEYSVSRNVRLIVLLKNHIGLAFRIAFLIPLAVPHSMWILFIHADSAGLIKLCESEDFFAVTQPTRDFRSHSSSYVLRAVLQPDHLW
jgi:hypothetical protein